MFLPVVKGQELAKLYLERALATGRLSHAYLFWGPRGCGKSLFTIELAKAIFCRGGDPSAAKDRAGATADERPCGVCTSCRTIDHGNHPGVNFFGPPEGKQIVDIDTVREMCEETQYKSVDLQVHVLTHADQLSEPAANALLKTLEEPPDRTMMILLANSTGSLPRTVVSRCHRVPFVRRDVEEMRPTMEQLELLEAVSAGGWGSLDPKDWLARFATDAKNNREAVERVLGAVLYRTRERLNQAEPAELDGEIRALDRQLDLLAALFRNVHPELVLEELFRS